MSNISPNFSYNESLLPQEDKLQILKRRKSLTIGIPKEEKKYENRIVLTPQSTNLLVESGHQIIVETNAGSGAYYTDLDYAEAGAIIANNKEDVYKSEIILKTAPFSDEEIELLQLRQAVFSPIHITCQNTDRIKRLMQKKVTAIAFEYVQGETNDFPVVNSMSEISGTAAIMIAAEYLSNFHYGKGVLLGGITGVTPTEIVIIGAGVAGESAARAALGQGAIVKIFDNSVYKLRQIQNKLGQRIYTSVVHKPVLVKALKSADVLIAAIEPSDKFSDFIISQEMVSRMKPGSVIVDISIDNYQSIETSKLTTHGNPIFHQHGVIHYCVPNIPSRVARTASIALSNIFRPILFEIGESGGLRQFLKENINVRQGVYIYNGILTNSIIGKTFNIPANNIDLLMAAF